MISDSTAVLKTSPLALGMPTESDPGEICPSPGSELPGISVQIAAAMLARASAVLPVWNG